MTLPAVRCRVCREVLRYDDARGTFLHREGSPANTAHPHMADPDPRDRRAFTLARLERRAEEAGA